MALSALFVGDTKRALKLFEQGRMNGARGEDYVVLDAYAAMGDLSTVLTSVYYDNMSGGNSDYAPLVALAYRAIAEPDFNFETERAAIEAVYEHAEGKPLDWTSTRGQVLAFQYRNYAAVKNPGMFWQIWWSRYPEALKASPHLKRWMSELGLPEFWRENGFPPQCKPLKSKDGGDDDFACE